MRVSFDFDGTLTKPDVQVAFNIMKTRENKLFIITSRNGPMNSHSNHDLNMFTSVFGIKHEDVIFTYGAPKHQSIVTFDIDRHYDDNSVEIRE
ncbi:MAG: hypothetical protein KAS32_17510, partial [Candidatus Peribacteraceae bacterium]|nr:hypothetical protein [Candidatus Peribacteraceae bacterium]